MRGLFLAIASIVLAGCASGRSTSDIPAVRGFELPKYLGRWYEIARLPQWFERDMDHVTAEYCADGDAVKVVNSGIRNGERREAVGRAVFAGDASEGELRVSFFRPFYGDYRIIMLDPDYRAAMVTSSTRDSLWILSRTPALPPEKLSEYLKQAELWGFDTAKLEYGKQE
ncbi:MAG: lipocalin family protein [Victivallaceae bacterium]